MAYGEDIVEERESGEEIIANSVEDASSETRNPGEADSVVWTDEACEAPQKSGAPDYEGEFASVSATARNWPRLKVSVEAMIIFLEEKNGGLPLPWMIKRFGPAVQFLWEKGIVEITLEATKGGAQHFIGLASSYRRTNGGDTLMAFLEKTPSAYSVEGMVKYFGSAVEALIDVGLLQTGNSSDGVPTVWLPPKITSAQPETQR